MYLYATNTSTASVKLTIEAGGTTSPDDLIEVTIPAEDGLFQVLPGTRFNNGVVIRGFAASANVINVVGIVNRILKVETL